MRYIKRYPTARSSLVRVTCGTASCKWCGSRRHDKNGRELVAYAYGWLSDGRTNTHHDGPFCSIECYHAYNDH